MQKRPLTYGTLGMVVMFTMFTNTDNMAQQAEPGGQAIGWTTINPSDPLQTQLGARYIPELTFSLPGDGFTVDGVLSVSARMSGIFQGDSLQPDAALSPYRFWIRIAWDQLELRAGLQKINFGSAVMFRPLMWFDRIDPRDPLQLTDGVYGLLARYYFLNNANIWLWGLYGDDKTKGWELIPSKKNSLEYGGRIQLPLYTGEIAASYHHRTADPSGAFPGSVTPGEAAAENRIALDAKMDLAIGLWSEISLTHQALNFTDLQYKSMLNTGMDYTFNLGNGLNMLTEAFGYLQGSSPFGADEKVVFGLLSATYPVTIIHNVSAMFFYDFTNKEIYRFINWSMAYDQWSFYIMGFWNPETFNLYNTDLRTSLYGGWGIQLMAVFSH